MNYSCIRGIIIILILSSCCASRQPVSRITSRDSVSIERIQTLVPVVIPSDSARARALLECSRDGVVLLSKLYVEQSRTAHLRLMLDSLGNLDVKADFRPDTVYIPRDSIIYREAKERTVVEVEYRDRPLTKWQAFIRGFGTATFWIFAGFVISMAVSMLYKFLVKKG